jgi:trigger factor
MNLQQKPSGPWQHTLDVEIPADEVELRLDEAARTIQRRATLPGFRKGRVPLTMVRQQFADHVEAEFQDSFVPKLVNEAVDQARLTPVIPPLVRIPQFLPNAPLKLEVVVDVKPEVEVKHYKGLRATRHVKNVDEARVEAVLADLREQSAVFADLDRGAQRGDVVLLDSTRLDANGRRLSGSRSKNQRLELGAAGMLPDLENGLLGAVAGQERTIDVEYPADYERSELAGNKVRYVISVRKIQEKKLRPLDDNLAKDVFQLQSLEELRSRVRLNLEGEERVRMQRELETALSEELVQRNPVELPERLVQWMLERVVHEATEGRTVPEPLRKELEGRFRPNVERSLRREALLESVARQEHLEVTEEEVNAEIQRMADADPRQGARIRARYQSQDRRRAMRESLLERKALDWLINAADIQEEFVAESPLVVPAGR